MATFYNIYLKQTNRSLIHLNIRGWNIKACSETPRLSETVESTGAIKSLNSLFASLTHTDVSTLVPQWFAGFKAFRLVDVCLLSWASSLLLFCVSV